MILPARLTGDEPLAVGGDQLAGGRVVDFWQWSMSSLLDNTVRGLFAENLVARALGCTSTGVRVEWDAVDIVTKSGLRVEVRSVSFLQSWPPFQASPSAPTPSFWAHTGIHGHYSLTAALTGVPPTFHSC